MKNKVFPALAVRLYSLAATLAYAGDGTGAASAPDAHTPAAYKSQSTIALDIVAFFGPKR